MESELLEILKEAVETKQRKEELDRSLGRALRRRNKDFATFMKMTSELRELALKQKSSIDEVARDLLAKYENRAN